MTLIRTLIETIACSFAVWPLMTVVADCHAVHPGTFSRAINFALRVIGNASKICINRVMNQFICVLSFFKWSNKKQFNKWSVQGEGLGKKYRDGCGCERYKPNYTIVFRRANWYNCAKRTQQPRPGHCSCASTYPLQLQWILSSWVNGAWSKLHCLA